MVKVKSSHHLIQTLGTLSIERPSGYEFLLDEASAKLAEEAGIITILNKEISPKPRTSAKQRETK